MAIYHLHANTGNRGHDGKSRRGKNKKPKAGQSAKAKHNYICREGKYSRNPDEVLFSESGNMPKWAAKDAGVYWDAADLYERKNGRLFKEIEFALPRELTLEQQIDTIRLFAEHIVGADDLPYTYAVHTGKGRNPHCHLMLNERINDGIERTADTWFKRAANKGKPAEKGGARKSEMLKPGDWLDNTRAAWSSFANDALERFGHNQRIDHRTLAAQRIDRLPQIHIGPNVAAMAERGILTDRLEYIEQINEYNQLRTEDAELEREIGAAVEALDAESRQECTAAAADARYIQPPANAAAPYLPDDEPEQTDDSLLLALQSQKRDRIEQQIGKRHQLQIRASLRALYSIQQPLPPLSCRNQHRHQLLKNRYKPRHSALQRRLSLSQNQHHRHRRSRHLMPDSEHLRSSKWRHQRSVLKRFALQRRGIKTTMTRSISSLNRCYLHQPAS